MTAHHNREEAAVDALDEAPGNALDAVRPCLAEWLACIGWCQAVTRGAMCGAKYGTKCGAV